MPSIKDLLLLGLSKTILPAILHYANRYAANAYSGKDEFYKIKTKILKAYATFIGYDIQHIEGKICWTCGGTGDYKKYSYNGRVYDIDSCWSCAGTGWYRDHKFILLEVYTFGKYQFHNPTIKKETLGKCPFPTPEGTKIIKGYIGHGYSKLGVYCITILFAFSNKELFKQYCRRIFSQWTSPVQRIRNKISRLRRNKWQEFIVSIPKWPKLYFIKADGTLEEINDIPF